MKPLMKPLRPFLATTAALLTPFALTACGGTGIPGDSVASVAGNPISTAAFSHWMYVAAKGNAAQSPGAPVIVPTDPPQFDGCLRQVRKQIPALAKQTDATVRKDCKQLFTSLSSQVMDFLIRAYWYQADAAKQGVKVSDADVQKAFLKAKSTQFPTATQFNAFLAQTGQTMQDILFRVRVNQVYRTLLKKQNVTVTPAAIAAYYTSHGTQFGTPQTLNLKLVRTTSAARAQAALKALRSRQDFRVVARKYSVDAATKNTGGVLVGVAKGQEEAALDTAIFNAPVGQLRGPVHGQFGYYVFEVSSRKAATHQSLIQATPLIKQILTAQTQTKAQSAVDAKARGDWKAKTRCRQDYAVADCSGYTPPKTTPLGITTTPTH